jgi:hypothetical protein
VTMGSTIRKVVDARVRVEKRAANRNAAGSTSRPRHSSTFIITITTEPGRKACHFLSFVAHRTWTC